jgi:hypothetical protein
VKEIELKREDEIPISADDRIITERVLIAVVEKEQDPVKETEQLMQAELRFMRGRLEIMREHNLHDPNQVEKRETKKFGRLQYKILIGTAVLGLAALPFVNLASGTIFGIIATLVFSGALLNGRDRASDAEAFTEILREVAKMFKGVKS